MRRHQRYQSSGKILQAIFVGLFVTLSLPYTYSQNSGVSVLRTFDELPANDPLYNQYDGMTFLGGDAFDHPVSVGTFQNSTISPPLGGFAMGRSAELGYPRVVMQFEQSQSQVSLSTGIPYNDPAGLTLLFQGFDHDPSDGAGSGWDRHSDMPLTQSVANLCSANSTPLNTNVEINDLQARIRFASLSVVRCATPYDSHSAGPSTSSVFFDNLAYQRPLHPSPRDHNPPVVQITKPLNGSTVEGDVPGLLDFTLLGTVTEHALMRLTMEVNGQPPVPIHYTRSGQNTYQLGMQVGALHGLREGDNSIRLVAVDFDQPQNTSSATVNFKFKKKAIPPPVEVDILPIAYQITQSMQGGPISFLQSDIDTGYSGYRVNAPALLQGKRTLLRIYGAVSGTSSRIDNVPARLDVRRDHCQTDCNIPGGQNLYPQDSFTTAWNGIPLWPVNDPTSSPHRIANNGTEGLRFTWNFVLPPEWTNMDLVLIVYTNCCGTSVPECDAQGSPYRCKGNNRVQIHLHFEPVQSITVHPVIVRVHQACSGNVDCVPDHSQVDRIMDTIGELFPMRVERGLDRSITVPRSISGGDLLERIAEFYPNCSFAGLGCGIAYHPNEFYLGIFPGDKGDFPANNNDRAGLGELGGFGAWVDADDPTGGAHELAHNIGLSHWACENGVEKHWYDGKRACDVFPIPHGGLGDTIIGTDILGWRVIPPGDMSSNATPHAHDFQTYGHVCEKYSHVPGCHTGSWVSWFTYELLRLHPFIDSYSWWDPLAYLVRGQIEGQKAILKPLYQVSITGELRDTHVEDDPQTITTLEGYDPSGNKLFVRNFLPRKLETHTKEEVFAFQELVPFVINLHRLRVRRGIEVLAESQNQSIGQSPTVIITEPTDQNVWSPGTSHTIHWTAQSPSGLPLKALVEYSPDNGITKVNLGRDVVGNELTVDADQLSASTEARIFVQVSDGFNVGMAQSNVFRIGDKPPKVRILMPHSGKKFKNVRIELDGTASDPEEVIPDAAYKWSSDRDGMLGTGKRLLVSSLSKGKHTLTLSATDRTGQSGSDAVIIEVDTPSLPQITADIVSRGIEDELGGGKSAFIDIELANAGPGSAEELIMNRVAAWVLEQSESEPRGGVMYKSPNLPLHIGNLSPGGRHKFRLFFRMHPVVTNFAITLEGKGKDEGGEEITYSLRDRPVF